MAQRRMFSNKIVSSARFLKMPVSSQLLYFHLGLNADDDGVVEGYNIMRMMNCTEDDLKILVAKGFVIVLNEDLVTFVTDWKEHNLIRADRKIDSIYKDLLIKMVEGIELTEPKRRADLKRKEIGSIEESGRPVDNQGTTNGQHRLGKVSIGKDSINKEKRDKIDYTQDIKDIRNIYKGTKSKKVADTKLPKLIKQYGKDQLIRGIERYINFVELERNNGFRTLKYKNEATYWNGGYVDYLDGNYEELEEQHGSTRENNAEGKYTGFKPQQPKITEEFDTTDLI